MSTKPKMKFIVRCTPTLGTVSVYWAKAMEDMLHPMNCIKGVSYMRDVEGDEIAECRNKLVAQVLGFNTEEHEADSIFWIDDDVIPTKGALLQLYSHSKPIVSGVYFTKMPGMLAEPLIFPSKGGGADKFIPAASDGQRSYEVWGHGMGLTLVKTEVYAKIRDELKLPLDKYGNPQWYKTTRLANEVHIDRTGPIPIIDCGGTEDLYFLELAHKCGYKPVIDCSKYAFGFHHDKGTNRGYPEPQWKQYSEGRPVEWETPTGIVRWE